ncbi:MAG: hypothetical protein R2838_14700 [Caldilineaceae bacterium]
MNSTRNWSARSSSRASCRTTTREPWFMCYAHSRQDIAETLTALDEAVVEVKRGHQAATVFAVANQ